MGDPLDDGPAVVGVIRAERVADLCLQTLSELLDVRLSLRRRLGGRLVCLERSLVHSLRGCLRLRGAQLLAATFRLGVSIAVLQAAPLEILQELLQSPPLRARRLRIGTHLGIGVLGLLDRRRRRRAWQGLPRVVVGTIGGQVPALPAPAARQRT